MCNSVPSARYSSICNVLRQWSISLIPTDSLLTLIGKEYSLLNKLIISVQPAQVCHRCVIGVTGMSQVSQADEQIIWLKHQPVVHQLYTYLKAGIICGD